MINLKLNHLEIVFSVGQFYDSFQDLIQNNDYKLPNNVYLFKFVPQLEILKRASLFITHGYYFLIRQARKYI